MYPQIWVVNELAPMTKEAATFRTKDLGMNTQLTSLERLPKLNCLK